MAENADTDSISTPSGGDSDPIAGDAENLQSVHSSAKPRSAKSVLGRLVFPFILGFSAGLGMFLSIQMGNLPSESTALKRQSVASRPEIPPDPSAPLDQPLRVGEAMPQADELLVAGDVVRALDVYEQLAANSQGQLGEMLEYRLAVCAELLGRRDRALAAYTALAIQSTDDRLIVAARLGAARVWFALDNLEAANTLLCNVLLESTLHKDAMRQFGDDVANLLAHIRARQVDPEATDSLIDDLGIARPRLSWSPLASLIMNRDSAAPAAADLKAAAPGIAILQKFGDEPADIQVTAHLERMAFGQIYQRLSNATGRRIIVSRQAEQAAVGKAVQLAVHNVSLDELLDNLVGPLGLTWHDDAAAIHIRSFDELSDEQAAQRRGQLASRSLHRAVTLYPDHPLCASSYLALGNQAFRQRKYKNAIAHYRHLKRQYPRSNADREASFNEAKAHLLLGDLNGSRIAFLEVVDALQGHPLEPAAYLYIGRLDLDSGKPRVASTTLKRALSLSTQKEIRQVAAVTLASAYLLWEKPHAANGVLMEHHAILDNSPYAATAAFLSALARFNALDDLQRNEVTGRNLIVTATHTDAKTFFGMHGFLLLGQAYQSLGYVDHMAKVYTEALELDIHGEPRDRLLVRLAEYEIDRGDRARFDRLIQEVVESGHGPWPRRAQFRIAAAALADGQDEQCLAVCRKLLNDGQPSDEDADILELMGRVYERRSDHYNAALCFSGMKPTSDSPSQMQKEN